MGANCTRALFIVLTVLAGACYVHEEQAPPPPAPVAVAAPPPPAPPPPPPAPPPAPPPPPGAAPAPPPASPAPPAAKTPAQWTPGSVTASKPAPLGCFRDQGQAAGTGGRDLDGFAENVPGMTTEMCAETCASKGFPLAATQYSTWCFCGTTYGKSGPAGGCTMKCGGNQKEICGGEWANSVYQVRPGPLMAPSLRVGH